MKKMTSVMRNQLCVCIAMLILCVFACGCSEVQRLDTKQDNTSTNADVYVIDETQVSAEVQATTNDSTTEVSALGLTEVSSMKEALDFLFESYNGYPKSWEDMSVEDIMDETKHGKVGENINLDGCKGNLTRSNLSYFCDQYNSGRAIGRIIVQNSLNGKIYILEITGKMESNMYEKLTTSIVDGFYWNAIWLRPRVKFPKDSQKYEEILSIASKIDTLWNDDCAEKYPCVAGEVIFGDIEPQTLKDWYFSYFDIVACKTNSGEYVIICGWNDHTDTIFCVSDSGTEIVEASEEKLDTVIEVMPFN